MKSRTFSPDKDKGFETDKERKRDKIEERQEKRREGF